MRPHIHCLKHVVLQDAFHSSAAQMGMADSDSYKVLTRSLQGPCKLADFRSPLECWEDGRGLVGRPTPLLREGERGEEDGKCDRQERTGKRGKGVEGTRGQLHEKGNKKKREKSKTLQRSTY